MFLFLCFILRSILNDDHKVERNRLLINLSHLCFNDHRLLQKYLQHGSLNTMFNKSARNRKIIVYACMGMEVSRVS